MQSPYAIDFANVSVDNATRAAVDPSTTTNGVNSIKSFDVWAFVDETSGRVFVDEDVTKNGDDWKYANTQYWLPDHTYYFGALAPMNSANWELNTANANTNGAGTVSFTNVNGTEDLLYAATSVTTSDNINVTPGKVGLAFNHLLSKVKFSFTNGFVNPNNTLIVKNIKMVVPGEGSINLSNGAWWEDEMGATWQLGQKTTTLSFGHIKDGSHVTVGEKAECDFERLTIPASADQKYIVTFDVALYSGDVVLYTRSLSTTISGAQLRIGNAYNFTTVLNHANIAETVLSPIEFNVEVVKDWADGNGYNGGTVNTDVASVSSAAEFAANLAAGYTSFRLIDNVTMAEGLQINDAKAYTIDLNGKTLGYTGDDVLFRINAAANVTIDGSANGSAIVTEPTTPGDASKGNGYVALVKGGATLNINGGIYDARNTCTIAQVSVGTLNVYGGSFSVNTDDYTDANGNASYLLNCSDATYKNNTAVINVYGGSFTKFNPENNAAEGTGTNFVVKGYGVEVDGDVYTVKALPAVTINGSQVLNTNVVIEGSAAVTGTLDGAGYTLYAAEAPVATGSVAPLVTLAGEATVKNLTIDGANRKAGDKSLRALYINAEGTYTIDNVITTGTGYALNVNTTKNVTLNVSNSTLEGWTSYNPATTATFTTVKFTKGTYYSNSDNNGYFRPYGETVLNNCDFALGFIIDFSQLVKNGKNITFNNCTYGGQPLTAIPAHWENYLTSNNEVVANITIQNN